MRKLVGIGIAVSLVFGALACKDASEEIVKLADKACACADTACAEGVLTEFATFMKENKNARGDQEKANAAGEKFAKCIVEKGVDPSKLMETLSEAAK